MIEIICQHCGKEFMAQRRTRKFCSVSCSNRSNWAGEKERHCKICDKIFKLYNAGDANRRYCSHACAKKANTKNTLQWHQEHPNAKHKYNKNRLVKNPGEWRDKHRNERLKAIEILGGKCIVCGATNTNWLHIDYKPTTINKPYRHPRHLKYIKEHIDEFRLLCANHHYELPLTGKIEGTTITQLTRKEAANAKEKTKTS